MGKANGGAVYIYELPRSGRVGVEDAQAVIVGAVFLGQAGFALTGVGDLNHDGLDDLALSAPFEDEGRGTVYIFYGPLSGRRTTAHADVVLTGDGRDDRFGASMTTVQPGTPTTPAVFSIGAQGAYGGKGSVYSIKGPLRSTGGRASSVAGCISLDNDAAFRAELGLGLASGVYSNDDDAIPVLLVGAPGQSNIGAQAGALCEFRPRTSGVETVRDLRPSVQGEAGPEAFGDELTPAGDIDGDGLDDVLVATPNPGSLNGAASRVYLIYGSEVGAPRRQVRITGIGSRFGASSAGGGDVNGDGFGDILLALPWALCPVPYVCRRPVNTGGPILAGDRGPARPRPTTRLAVASS